MSEVKKDKDAAKKRREPDTSKPDDTYFGETEMYL